MRPHASPTERPVSPKDLAATLYQFFGIDPFQEYRSVEGRGPQKNGAASEGRGTHEARVPGAEGTEKIRKSEAARADRLTRRLLQEL